MEENRKSIIRYVTVKHFIENDYDGITGICGECWPRGERISVFLDSYTEKARNKNRPSFADLSSGRLPFFYGKPRMLEAGGVLRLRLFQVPSFPGQYTTDWPYVVTWNEKESATLLHYGYGNVKVYTPHEVRRVLDWFNRSDEGKDAIFDYMAKHPDMHPEVALEIALAEKMHGFNRYNAQFYLYDPDSCMESDNKEELHERLYAYFRDPDFIPIQSPHGRFYRPVRPTLFLRHLDASGEVVRCLSFKPADSQNPFFAGHNHTDLREFMRAEECASRAVGMLQKADSWNILPGKVYVCSSEKTRLGALQNVAMLKGLWYFAGLREREKNGGEDLHQLGVKVAEGGSRLAVELMYDSDGKVLSPASLHEESEKRESPEALHMSPMA